MKRIISGMALISVLALAGTASANNGNPQNCEANPQQPFCNNGPTITVEQPTAQECPAGGLVLVVGNVRYPVCNGVNGTNGADGKDGANGSNGAPGSPGSNGTDGATGSAGPTGVSGATGSQGVSGNAGSNGGSGATGAAGPAGTTTVIHKTVKGKKWTCIRREHRVHGKRKLLVACKKKGVKQKPYIIRLP